MKGVYTQPKESKLEDLIREKERKTHVLPGGPVAELSKPMVVKLRDQINKRFESVNLNETVMVEHSRSALNNYTTKNSRNVS